jgi:uncharacterized phage protein (TIGR02218 family)
MPRPCSGALALALPSGGMELSRADLFTFTLSDGVTVCNWTSWRQDLVVGGVTYSSRAPWIGRGKWNVTNTMAVPSLEVKTLACNDGFAGGANFKTQVHNGLFDGAAFVLQSVFMPAPGDVTTLGAVTLFTGVVAGIELDGTTATITCKGKNNLLDQYAPRNVYQIGCIDAFCDAGCTLNRASFTASYAVGTSPAPTRSFLPWASAPSTPGVYLSGTVTMTSGAASGQKRTIAKADSTGLTLAYPLYEVPAPGDAFTAFQGCDKTFNGSGSVQSCTSYSNTQNYRGFPFVPPPNSAY